ncbi:MAG: glycosyltransferase family 1 protein [Chitinophagaceae bacterium]|nr:MAG: glycosyltransferase family 1 protein [Chitinophagaceae bacterium]
MVAKEKILFVVESGSLDYTIPGGVQVCTEELIHYFRLTRFEPDILPVKTTRRIRDRIKIRLGIDVYESFDFAALAARICEKLAQSETNIVALNQIVLAPVIPLVRKLLKRRVYFIALSHGNESGDYIHESIPPLLKRWKIGKQIFRERQFYSNYLDGVAVISEHEVGVNQWLGATNVFVLPRMLEDRALNWQPKADRVGFVGTLNHTPNLRGLLRVLEELQKLSFTGEVRIVGGPAEAGEELAKTFSFVHYLGKLSPQALEADAKTWSVFLNPVFWYSRGSSTKLAQGLNWCIPALTTPAGRRGYLLSDDSIVVPSHDPADFAHAILRFTQNRTALDRLYRSVCSNVATFDAVLIANQFEEFLRTIAKCPIKTTKEGSAF